MKVDKRNGKTLEDNPTSVSAGDALIAEITAHGNTFVERFCDIQSFGRFCFKEPNSSTIVGVGVVKDVKYKTK